MSTDPAETQETAPWEPGQPHSRPDPNVCPSCGASEMFQELARRHTWQPVRFGYDDPRPATEHRPAHEGTGQLTDEDYDSFDYGDEVEVTGYECRNCGDDWSTLLALAWAQRFAKALTDWAEYHERMYDRESEETPSAIHEASADAYRHALLIYQGNGEA